MQRVVALGGDLALETGATGTVLTVELPLPLEVRPARAAARQAKPRSGALRPRGAT